MCKPHCTVTQKQVYICGKIGSDHISQKKDSEKTLEDWKLTPQAGPHLEDCPQQSEARNKSANSKPGGEWEPYFQSCHIIALKRAVFNKKSQGRGATPSKWRSRRFLRSSPKENRFGRSPTEQTAFAGAQRWVPVRCWTEKSDTGCTEDAHTHVHT